MDRDFIKEKGITRFVDWEEECRTFPFCGARICVHRNNCPSCQKARTNGHQPDSSL